MSNLLANYQLLKAKCAANKVASENQQTEVNSVDAKGELLVGNGTSPDKLDPSTGSDGDVLSYNTGAPQGVSWETPTPIVPVVTGGYALFNAATTITPEQNNYYIEINVLSDPEGSHKIYLPRTSTIPDGYKVWLFVNTTYASSVQVQTAGNDSSNIDNNGTLIAYVDYSTRQLDQYIYNGTTNRWYRVQLED